MIEYKSIKKPAFTSFDTFLEQIQEACYGGWELVQILDGQKSFHTRAILKKTNAKG